MLMWSEGRVAVYRGRAARTVKWGKGSVPLLSNADEDEGKGGCGANGQTGSAQEPRWTCGRGLSARQGIGSTTPNEQGNTKLSARIKRGGGRKPADARRSLHEKQPYPVEGKSPSPYPS